MTVRWLLKVQPPYLQEERHKPPKLIVCTGERMHDIIKRLYRSHSIRNTTFRPQHTSGLSNEFYCYSNFECDAWEFADETASATSSGC